MNDVYFDNAATTPIKSSVQDKFIEVENKAWYNPETKYTHGKIASDIILEAKTMIAKSIGCHPEEIFFTSGATESNNLAMAIARNIGGKIVVSNVEHKSILNAAPFVDYEDKGYIGVDSDGIIWLSEMYTWLHGGEQGIMSVMAVNNETGAINPISLIGDACHNNGWVFHTDATQAIGKIPINVRGMHIDMLSATGHKLGAFKNTGFLYVNKDLHKYITPIIGGGGQQDGVRSGTESASLYFALALAVEESVQNMESNISKYCRFREIVLDALKNANISYSENCVSNKTNSIMSLTIHDVNAESLMNAADILGLSISAGSACNSKNIEPSYILLEIGLDKSEALNTIRISFREDLDEEYVTEGANRLVEAINLVKSA